MNCTNCSNLLLEGAKFCIYCGTPVEDSAPTAEPVEEANPVEETVAEAAQPTMSDEDRVAIYRAAVERIGINNEVSGSRVGQVLAANGIQWRSYGVKMMSEFFDLLGSDYVTYQFKEINGAQHAHATFLPVEGIEVELPEVAPVATASAMDDDTRLKIYRAGVQAFGLNVPIDCAKFGKLLNTPKVSVKWRDYGCAKMVDFCHLIGAPYLLVHVDTSTLTPTPYVTFLPVDGIEVELPEETVEPVAAVAPAAPVAAEAPTVATPVAESREMTDADRERLYRLCVANFGLNIEVSGAVLGQVLSAERKAFGCGSMEEFCSLIGEPYISFTTENINGTRHIRAKFQPVDDVAVTVPQTAAPVVTADPTELYGIRPMPEAMVADLPLTMPNNFYFVPEVLNRLNALICGVRSTPSPDAISNLEAAYQKARAERRFHIRVNSRGMKTYTFMLSHEDFGTQQDLACDIQENVHRVGVAEKYAVVHFNRCSTADVYQSLWDFAFLGANGNDLFTALENKALPEPDSWTIPGHRQPLYGLQNYLRFTFLRLAQTGKVLFSEHSDFAAFNTGLVDRFYRPLFACFVRNERENTSGIPWKFDSVSTEFDSVDLRLKLPRLPQRATYIEKLDDVVFDTKETGKLVLSGYHILIDNINRLPLTFLRQYLTHPTLITILDDIENRRDDIDTLYDSLRQELRKEEYDSCMRMLYDRFDKAVDQAKLRAQWNYKTAVPCYFPKAGKLSLMLPLSLVSDDRVDVALIVEREGEKNYIGRTILTLNMAYMDARLICRPESEWLNARSLQSAEAFSTDDE